MGSVLWGAVLISCTAWSAPPAGAHAQDGEDSVLIVLVRHAEPVFPPPEESPHDPPLNVMGQERADALARLLSAAGIEEVYSTSYRRTMETANPLAAQLGVTVRLYDPADLSAFAARLRATAGRTLVVGHSNTTPRLVELLGGEAGEAIDEGAEFDRAFVLTGSTGADLQTVVLRYGDAVPDDWRRWASRRRSAPEGAVADPAIRERRYCTDSGPFLIRFDRGQVAGFYAIGPQGHLGSFVGTLGGERIYGRWFEPSSSGQIEIDGEGDWARFVARYRADGEPEHWHEGWRGVEQPPGAPARIEDRGDTLLCERPPGDP